MKTRGDVIPRAAIIGLGLLLLATLLLAAGARLSGPPAQELSTAQTVAQRALWFRDRADGGIDIVDADADRLVHAVPPGSDGFLRSVVRGLARERKRAGLGPDQPFRLTAQADGRLTLDDPATGRRIALEAFGATNVAAFARLLANS